MRVCVRVFGEACQENGLKDLGKEGARITRGGRHGKSRATAQGASKGSLRTVPERSPTFLRPGAVKGLDNSPESSRWRPPTAVVA